MNPPEEKLGTGNVRKKQRLESKKRKNEAKFDMNRPEGKLVTWNVRKEQRLESKKRKIEAFLNLIAKEENLLPVKKKNSNETLKESYKNLKSELDKYVKKPSNEPAFYLTELGLKAQVNFQFYNKENPVGKTIFPLFIEDIYHLLLKSVIGNLSPYPVRWCNIEYPQNISRTFLIVVEGLSKYDIIQSISYLNNITNIFPYMVEIVSSNVPFATELSTLHLISDFHVQVEDTYSSLFPIQKENSYKITNCSIPSKLHLLLSPVQLVMENYPIPQSVFENSKSENYCFSKDSYSQVTADSPMFALDCEMCRTENGKSEVTRVAIVNEKLETVYHTFVKPKAKVTDYMTKFSGVTREMLQDVKVRLSDVQRDIRNLLPSDAILCGQSLNCDLHALQMIHPYVIDTSVIYNGSGIRNKKDSLKSLTLMHLNEKIQDRKSGHDPTEDSLATMKLVLLKLGNSIQFGDAVLRDDASSKADSVIKEILNRNEQIHLSDTVTANSFGKKDSLEQNAKFFTLKNDQKPIKSIDSFFARTSRFSKTVCLIGSKDSLDHYCSDMLTKNVQKIKKTNSKKILRATSNNLGNFDLTIAHYVFDSSKTPDSVLELNDILKQSFDLCSNKTLFIVLASGVDKTKFEDLKSGLCMAVLKKEK